MEAVLFLNEGQELLPQQEKVINKKFDKINVFRLKPDITIRQMDDICDDFMNNDFDGVVFANGTPPYLLASMVSSREIEQREYIFPTGNNIFVFHYDKDKGWLLA